MKKRLKMLLSCVILAAGFLIGFMAGAAALSILQNAMTDVQVNGYDDCAESDCQKCDRDCVFNEK